MGFTLYELINFEMYARQKKIVLKPHIKVKVNEWKVCSFNINSLNLNVDGFYKYMCDIYDTFTFRKFAHIKISSELLSLSLILILCCFGAFTIRIAIQQ